MNVATPRPPLPARAREVPAVALAVVALLLVVAPRYGVFRDELYYVACGDHLAWGYVDHPPLVAVLARVARLLFGSSVVGLRVLPAIAAGLTVVVSAELARAMRGGRFAQLLAAVCTASAPEYLGGDHFLSMNAFLPLAWGGAALGATYALLHDRPRGWIAVGASCGLGLLLKHSTFFFGAALVAGLLVDPRRAVLRTRGPWLALGIAAALFAPNVAWELAHGLPTLEFMHNAQAHKMVAMSPVAFLADLTLTMLPASLPVWAAGAVWMLSPSGRDFRFLGVTFAGTVAIVLVAHGKPYYVAPVFPLAFGAGSVLAERWFRRPWVRGVVASLIGASGLAIAPLAIPLLAPESFLRYSTALGVGSAPNEKHEMGPLPQHLADQFGWEAMAARVADAYLALSPQERAQAAIYTSNYGEAGAIDYFGPRWGLPKAVSGHNSYFLWGPPPDGRGAVLVSIGEDREDLEKTYESVLQVGETDEPYAMPYENHLPIYVCRSPRRPLDGVWASTKHYI